MVEDNTYSPADDDEINLGDLVKTFRRRWPTFAVTFGMVFSLVAIYTLTREPVYRATGIIMIEKQGQGGALSALGGLAQMGGLAGLGGQSSPLSTQMEILKSNTVLKETIQDLDLRQKPNSQEPLLTSDFITMIEVEEIPETDLISVSFDSPDPEKAKQVVNQLIENYTKSSLDLSRQQKRLSREFIQSQIPAAQKDLETKLAQIREFQEEKGIFSQGTQTQELALQISELEKNIINSSVELEQLNQSQSRLEKVFNFDFKTATQSTSLIESEAIQSAIISLQKTQTELDKATAQYTPNHPSVQALRRQLDSQKVTLDNLISTLVQDNDLLKNLSPVEVGRGDFSLELLRDQIKNDIMIDALNKRLQSLQTQINDRRNFAATLPQTQQRLIRLQVDLEVSQARLKNLLTVFQNARFAENMEIGSAVIVEPAYVLDNPVSPKIMRNLVVGGVLGLVFGFIAVLIRDRLDKTLHTVEEIDSIFANLTRLGAVPIFQSRPDASYIPNGYYGDPFLVPEDINSRHDKEALRQIFSNIRFSNSDRHLQLITISSCLSHEGKSTIVAKLGQAITEFGCKVLIIDADLRHPMQHSIWQISNRVGLASILADNTLFNDCVQIKTEDLHILPTGPIPHNPLMLLESQGFLTLLDEIKTQYDYILLDTAPLTTATETLSLSQLSDGFVLVTRPGHLTRDVAVEVNQSIIPNIKNKIGFIANGVKRKPSQSYYYDGQANGNNPPHPTTAPTFLKSLAERVKSAIN